MLGLDDPNLECLGANCVPLCFLWRLEIWSQTWMSQPRACRLSFQPTPGLKRVAEIWATFLHIYICWCRGAWALPCQLSFFVYLLASWLAAWLAFWLAAQSGAHLFLHPLLFRHLWKSPYFRDTPILMDPWMYPRIYWHVNRSLDISKDLLICWLVSGCIRKSLKMLVDPWEYSFRLGRPPGRLI